MVYCTNGDQTRHVYFSIAVFERWVSVKPSVLVSFSSGAPGWDPPGCVPLCFGHATYLLLFYYSCPFVYNRVFCRVMCTT